MNKKIKTILIISLLCNMLFAGFAVGQLMHIKPNRAGSGIVREFMQTHRDLQDNIDREKRITLDLVKQTTFDETAFSAQIARINALQGKMYREFSFSMAKKLRSMTPQERDELIEKISKRGKPRR
ncbi:MAG: hypothetical protein LBU87_01025 [Lactobacillales bacterium]|jgi:uncharacterized membrane protein|nr:hypothetical protein [Lactobacillales bacterium]